jgi:hypothetical protein
LTDVWVLVFSKFQRLVCVWLTSDWSIEGVGVGKTRLLLRVVPELAAGNCLVFTVVL